MASQEAFISFQAAEECIRAGFLPITTYWPRDSFLSGSPGPTGGSGAQTSRQRVLCSTASTVIPDS